MKSFNVVIATSGRDTLQRMIDSIAPQLKENDYITIIWDCEPFEVFINSSCSVFHIHNPEPLGFWGHGSRNRWQDELPGDYLINGDDDDIFTDDAMQHIRRHCTDDKLYIFKMISNYITIPSTRDIKFGNIGTPCGVYKPGNLPKWGKRYGGDFDFYDQLSKIKESVFVGELIYIVKP